MLGGVELGFFDGDCPFDSKFGEVLFGGGGLQRCCILCSSQPGQCSLPLRAYKGAAVGLHNDINSLIWQAQGRRAPLAGQFVCILEVTLASVYLDKTTVAIGREVLLHAVTGVRRGRRPILLCLAGTKYLSWLFQRIHGGV